ncbi:MAG: TylF/MycF/NovP-related O-methyltransferase [Caldimonas sp.]
MLKKKKLIRRLFEKSGWTVAKIRPEAYDQDNLSTPHNHDFMADPAFLRAYRRGVEAADDDYHWHWRVHIGLWVAFNASRLPGDFVECGVNRGFLSSAIMKDLDWDALGKTFWLMDTFTGIDERYITDDERAAGILERNHSEFYTTNLESVRKNFAEWKNARIVAGAIPDTLAAVDSPQIAYLHLDMNCAPPEVAAFRHFWSRLVPGAFVLLDDYAYKGFESQKAAMDAAAAEVDARIASLPTGQGLLVKSN